MHLRVVEAWNHRPVTKIDHFDIRAAKSHDLFIDPTDANRPFPNRNGLGE
jgi:hypothetical protein